MLSRSGFLNRIKCGCQIISTLNLNSKNTIYLIDLRNDVRLANSSAIDRKESLFKKYLSITSRIKEQLEKNQKLNDKATHLLNRIEVICNEIQELEQFDTDNENDLKDLAKDDLSILSTQFEDLKNDLIDLLRTESYLTNDVTMEFENGVGGNEAMIFTKEMVNFYIQFCKSQNWSVNMVEFEQSNDVDGYLFCTLRVTGKDCFELLRHEAGVHRVQRIPTTDKMNRIHTSTFAIKVVPIFNEAEIDLSTKNVQIDRMKSSGPGGMNVNKRETAVRITHLPSNIAIRCEEHRTQEENTKAAFEKLKIKLSEMRYKELRERDQKIRSSQVKSVLRSEKIRTYNFPQDRITDHRIKRDMSNLKGFFTGNCNQSLMNWIEELNREHKAMLNRDTDCDLTKFK